MLDAPDLLWTGLCSQTQFANDWLEGILVDRDFIFYFNLPRSLAASVAVQAPSRFTWRSFWLLPSEKRFKFAAMPSSTTVSRATADFCPGCSLVPQFAWLFLRTFAYIHEVFSWRLAGRKFSFYAMATSNLDAYRSQERRAFQSLRIESDFFSLEPLFVRIDFISMLSVYYHLKLLLLSLS